MTTAQELKPMKFKIQSVPENISFVETFIEQIRDAVTLSDEVYGNILVALTEAVNNAIFHGNKCDSKKLVDVWIEKKNDVLLFTINDEGVGFNYDSLPDPTAPEYIEKPTGRGVFLMKQLSDKISFRNNGKSVEMQFKIS